MGAEVLFVGIACQFAKSFVCDRLHACQVSRQRWETEVCNIMFRFCAFAFLAGAHALKSQSGGLGEDLARTVLQAAASSSSTEVLNALVPQNPASDRIAKMAADVADGRPQANLLVCDADFSAACPDGWSQSGSTCSAPSSYTGPCERQKQFSATDVAGKVVFAQDCEAPWPCKEDRAACPSGHDFDSCPKGWSQAAFGFCETTSDNPCGKVFHFASLSGSEKSSLTKACGLSWPCL